RRLWPSLAVTDVEVRQVVRNALTRGNPAEHYDENGAPIRWHKAWHGSPHRFDRFSTQAIGSGEGAQAYGWGLYFTDAKAVAEFYRDSLSRERGFSYSERAGLTREEV